MQLRFILMGAALLSLFITVPAEDDRDIEFGSSGFAIFQFGQMVKLSGVDKDFEGRRDQQIKGRLTLSATINEQLKIIVGAEGRKAVNLHDNSKKDDPLALKEAQGIYSYGDPQSPLIQAAAGYFPLKYNPEAKNLGEYMYRTGTYPGYIINDFDNAKARLIGLRITANPIENLQVNALFTSEYTMQPFFDYSLGILAGYNVKDIIHIGAGILFDRLVPMHKYKTTPKENKVKDKAGNYIIEGGRDSTVIDLLGNPTIKKVGGDTLRYTFKGTKLMAQISFDFKPLLPFAHMLGPEDFTLYAEAALLGWKDYGSEYPDKLNRLPVMAGFHVPTFKILDVLAVEVEYYNSLKKHWLNLLTEGAPIPTLWTGTRDKSKWKWSVFAKKTVVKGFALVGLAARDHYRDVSPGGSPEPREQLNLPKDWHYKLKGQFSF